MATLLPPNSTKLERDLDATIDARLTALSDKVNLQDLWDADKCPVPFLPWLAYAVSVDRWNSSWPEQVKRAVIKASFPTHRIKGTRGAVEKVIEAFGADIQLTEWWEMSPPGTRGTFELAMIATDSEGNPVSAEMQQAIVDSVEATKRKSQHFDLVIGQNLVAPVMVSPVIVAAQYVRLGINVESELIKPITGFAASIYGSNPYQWLQLADTSGTTATDSSGNARHGTYSASVTLDQPEYPLGTMDLSDVSIYVNGDDGYVDTGLPSSLCDAEFTALLFFKPDSVATLSLAAMDTVLWYSWTDAYSGMPPLVVGIDNGRLALQIADENGITDLARGTTDLFADEFYGVMVIHDPAEKTVSIKLCKYPRWDEFEPEIIYTYATLLAGSADPGGEIFLADSAAVSGESYPAAFPGHLSNWVFWTRQLADGEASAQYENSTADSPYACPTDMGYYSDLLGLLDPDVLVTTDPNTTPVFIDGVTKPGCYPFLIRVPAWTLPSSWTENLRLISGGPVSLFAINAEGGLGLQGVTGPAGWFMGTSPSATHFIDLFVVGVNSDDSATPFSLRLGGPPEK